MTKSTKHLPVTKQTIPMPSVQTPKKLVPTKHMLFEMQNIAVELARGGIYDMGTIYMYLHAVWMLGVPLESLRECMTEGIHISTKANVDLATVLAPFVAIYRKA